MANKRQKKKNIKKHNPALAMVFPHKDKCGHCEHARLMEKYILSVPDHKKAKGAHKCRIAWEKTKYFKFAKECQRAGLDWQSEFQKRGWEP